jgi:hypothetical protein
MLTPDNKKRAVVAGVVVLFMVLIVTILFLMVKRVITVQMGMLMFVALLGMYLGFGVLIAIYRFVGRLQ